MPVEYAKITTLNSMVKRSDNVCEKLFWGEGGGSENQRYL